MLTKELTITEKTNKTIRELRKKKLANGNYFLCIVKHLPADQFIHEYPDGTFKVVKVTGVTTTPQFLRLATAEEIRNIKATHPAYGE